MFHTVRHWWESGRGKVTARLFAFEFVVVVTGVLVAQGLASWVQDRAAVRAMEESRARLLVEAANVGESALVWQRAIPCLGERMNAIMVAAGEGPIDSALTVRPSFLAANFPRMTEESELLFRSRHGEDAVIAMETIRANAVSLTERANRAASAWGRLVTAASSSGRVSEGDRIGARQSAADIIAELRGIGINADTILRSARRLGVTPVTSDVYEHRYGPAQSCHAIWKSSRIDPPLGMR